MDKEFDECVNSINNKKNTLILSDSIVGDFYKFYKQATVGDCNIDKPSIFDFTGCAKWNAWNSIKGMTCDEAKSNYIDLYKSVI